MIIKKFGGTSVQNAEAMSRVYDIISNEKELIIVFSACSGITNKLIEICNFALSDNQKALEIAEEVSNFHFSLSAQLNINQTAEDFIRQQIDSIKNLLEGVAILEELPKEISNEILSKGEILSSWIFTKYLEKHKIKAAYLDITKHLIYDKNYELINKDELLNLFQTYDILVTQGFIASNKQGNITTLGRGGSDWSAAIIGSELEAKKIEIWTDVDGIFTSDPRYIEQTHILNEITYQDLSYAAFLGAKVLHPETLAPALKNNIPVEIRNTFNPHSKGTLILEHTNQQYFIIAFKPEIYKFTLYSKYYNDFRELLNNDGTTILYESQIQKHQTLYVSSSKSYIDFISENYSDWFKTLESKAICSLILNPFISERIFEISRELSKLSFINDLDLHFEPSGNLLLLITPPEKSIDLAKELHRIMLI